MKPIDLHLKEQLAKELLEAGHYVEVSGEFIKLVGLNDDDIVAELYQETAERKFYFINGTGIQEVINYLGSGRPQYFIQDINA